MGIGLHQRLRDTRSFTLVEMMMGMVVGAFVLAAVLTSYLFCMKAYQAISNYREIHAGGRHAVDRFAKDMRAVYGITSMTTTSLVVTIPTSFSSSGVVLSNKTVTYKYKSSALYRQDTFTGENDQLCTNIYSLEWVLYDHVGSNTTLIGSAKAIQMHIKLRKQLMSTLQTEDYLSTKFDMRNKP